MRRLTATLAALALAGCGGPPAAEQQQGLPFYTGPDITPRWIEPGSREYARIHRVADFELTNQDGQVITRRDLAGKVYVANFFFTACGQICPRLRSNLAAVQEAFAADDGVVLLSHSVTPEADSVDVLRRYARTNDIRSGKWHLLTGERAQILRLAKNSYFVKLNEATIPAPGDIIHTETFVLVDQQGRIRGLYTGSLPFDVEKLMDDIRVLRGQAPTRNAAL